jgi:Leucine-rich repeat (LRR) protein
LGGNQLAVVPPQFGKLEFLEVLDLSGNKLTSLPNEFPGMGRYAHLFHLLFATDRNNLNSPFPLKF